jgi:hypothetical protein
MRQSSEKLSKNGRLYEDVMKTSLSFSFKENQDNQKIKGARGSEIVFYAKGGFLQFKQKCFENILHLKNDILL